MLGGGPAASHRCRLCGDDDAVLLYPRNLSREGGPADFACTSEAVGEHDDIVQCRRCGMVSSRPTLSPEEIAETYAAVVDEDYLSEEEGRRELFEWIVDQMGGFALQGNRVLEAGAHLGLFLDVATKRGWTARGIEPSKWAVDYGREQYGVDLRQGTVEDLDAEPGSADVIVMNDVLEHLTDPLAALRRLRPVLAEDGLLVLATVNVRSLHARIRGEHWPWFILPHLHYFSPETLHATLSLAGYRTAQWSVVPRSFRLSYLARRGGENLGALGRAMAAVSRVADPKVPVGWLGDIVLVVARPDTADD